MSATGDIDFGAEIPPFKRTKQKNFMVGCTHHRKPLTGGFNDGSETQLNGWNQNPRRELREPLRAWRKEKSMHSLVKLGLAAALLAGAGSVSVAEDAATKPAASATTSATTDATTTASIGSNFDTLLSRMNAGTDIDLTGLSSTSNVKFVAIDTLQGWDMKKFDDTVAEKTADMTSLRGKIGANATLKSKLEGAGHAVDDVVAIEKGADGSFTVYVDDRA